MLLANRSIASLSLDPCLLPGAQNLMAAGKDKLYELGPGQQIKAMAKRLDNTVWKNLTNVSV